MVDETDAVAYVEEPMRNRLGTIATLQRIADGEGHELSPADVAAELGLLNRRVVAHASAHELADDARQQLDELPLAVESRTTYSIVLGTGGPDDRLEVEVEGERGGREVRGVLYRYSWTTNSATRRLVGDDLDLASEFARRVVPDLFDA
jgi:hypothetical protein